MQYPSGEHCAALLCRVPVGVAGVILTFARVGAFMWTNKHTIQFRARMNEFEAWKPALDVIHNSIELAPQRLAAANRTMNQRAEMALDTQQYINKVAREIVENRRRTHAEIRYENYLFISGQDEDVNPYTGKVELDTSAGTSYPPMKTATIRTSTKSARITSGSAPPCGHGDDVKLSNA